MAGIDAAVGANLPVSWALAPLGEVTRPGRPKVRPADFPQLPFIGMEHVEAHTMRLLGTVRAGTMKSQAVHFFPRDVLYGRLRPYLNKVFRPYFEGLCSAEFIVFPATEDFNEKYLQYFLNSSGFVSFAAHLDEGDRPRVDFTQLSVFLMPIAPLPEQRRIVAEIECQFTLLDAAVAGLGRVQASLGRYEASVLKTACEGRLVPTEAELARREGREYEPADQLLRRILENRRARWAAEQGQERKGMGRDSERILKGYHEPPVLDAKGMSKLPEGWVWASVEMVGDVLLGRQRAPQYLTGRFTRPYLRVANVKDDALDLRDVESMDFDETHFAKYRLIPGDILVSEGQSPELVGQSAIFRGGIENLCFQKTLHRFRPVPEGPGSEFAQLVFRAHVKSGVFRRVASITTNIAHLTLEKFKAAPFPLPPRAEQLRIVAEIERRLSIIATLEHLVRTNLERATRLRQAILKRAFEGGLAARDSNDEPASALLERIRASQASEPSLKRPGSPRENKSPVAAERAR